MNACEWMYHTLHEVYDEMERCQWNEVQHNRWARVLKASHRVGVRPIWFVEELEHEGKQLSWATATRSLRRLLQSPKAKTRIVKVGGKRDQPKDQTWKLEDAAQWELLFQGERVFWKTVGAIRAACRPPNRRPLRTSLRLPMTPFSRAVARRHCHRPRLWPHQSHMSDAQEHPHHPRPLMRPGSP